MAQPRAVIGGSFISAVMGIACTSLIQEPAIAAPLAVGTAILVMFLLHCLHPPAAALALLIALNGISDFQFAFTPVLVNTASLVIFATFYNTLTGKPYPHHLPQLTKLLRQSPADYKIQDQAVRTILAEYDEVIDISKDDLNKLIQEVEHRAHRKKLESIQCKDIMTRNVLTTTINTPLSRIWELLHSHQIKAIPVVDEDKKLIGIITLADLIKSFIDKTNQNFDIHMSLTSSQMSKKLMTIEENKNLIDLTTLFCGYGHHHIPVINSNKKLSGIITQSDFIKAINQSVINS